jgi:mono/diheme cytochrome c family protein
VEAAGIPATTSDADIAAQCNALADTIKNSGRATTEQAAEGKACRTFLTAYADFQTAQASLAWAVAWRDSRVNVSDGQLLFETYCARCHTQGWSIFDPTQPNSTRVLGPAGGGGGQGGGIGFNLRDGDTERRFGPGATKGTLGFDSQLQFIQQGSEANKQFGNGGIGSGRMPGFANMLTEQMIEQIVSFERNDLDNTVYLAPAPTTTTTPSSTTTTTGG